MKNNLLISKIVLSTLLFTGSASFIACDSKSNSQGQEIPSATKEVTVTVGNINDEEGSIPKFASTTGSVNKKSKQPLELITGDGFDALVAVDNNLPKSASANNINYIGSKSNLGLQAATTSPMTGGHTYRLYLYKKVGTDYVYSKSVALVAGTATQVTVDNGATYRWVALSYNNNDPIPDRLGSDDIALPVNKDVLYARSTTDFTTANPVVSPIVINFSRIYSRIGVEINTIGMFATIQSATASVSGHNAKSGTLNLTTKVLSNISAATTPTITFSNFTNVAGLADQKIAYYYTADPTPQNVTVSLSNLIINLDNGNPRSFPNTPLTRAVSITPELGKSNRILVGLTESALTLAGVKWSRSNLRFDNSKATKYRFNASNDYTATVDINSYFAFKGHFPRKFASANTSLQKDPCNLVYPQGLWKTPERSDLVEVENAEGAITTLIGDISGFLGSGTPGASGSTTHIEFIPSAGNNPAYGTATSSMNRLRFNYNGIQRNIAAIEDLITIGLGSTKGSQAAFWTRTQGADIFGIAGTGSYNFLGRTTFSAIGSPVYRGAASYDAFVLNAVGLNILSSNLMNVRCVRVPQATWTATSSAANYNPMPSYGTIPNGL